MSPGAQSPGLGCPRKKASACSGSFAERERSNALNSLRLGLSGSLRRGDPRDLASAQTRLGADREHGSAVGAWESALSKTSAFGSAKYDGLSAK